MGSLLDIVFPPRCASCHAQGDWICSVCAKRIEIIKTPICYHCHRLSADFKVCGKCRPTGAASRLIVYGYWQSPLKELVYSLKYRRLRPLVKILGGWLVETINQTTATTGLVIVPVPLHRGRLWDRGFNQARLLAEVVAQQTGWPLLPILFRKRSTQPQFGLSKSARRDNIEGAFSINVALSQNLANKTVVLVDDIVTTGATINECAKILRQNGARDVWGLVLAKA
ncbi:MAG: ComF family protein [Patescibacteria group bacterium]|jgi:ComF family protein